MVNLKDILYESLKNYRNMRPYTQAELEKEVDEYHANDYTKKKLPRMWKDKDDGYADIKGALYEFPSEEEIRSLENSDAGDILNTAPEDRMEKAIKLSKEYGKDYKRIIDGLNKVSGSGVVGTTAAVGGTSGAASAAYDMTYSWLNRMYRDANPVKYETKVPS